MIPDNDCTPIVAADGPNAVGGLVYALASGIQYAVLYNCIINITIRVVLAMFTSVCCSASPSTDSITEL